MLWVDWRLTLTFQIASHLLGDDNDTPQPSSEKNLEHEVAQLTKLRSAPHKRLKQVLPRRPEFPVSPVKMLAGRKWNYSGRGRFIAAARCHLLNKYLPVKGPSIVDQLTTWAYVSQFSDHGSLFVAAFQVFLFVCWPIIQVITNQNMNFIASLKFLRSFILCWIMILMFQVFGFQG